jgi:hypothetical protein
LGYVPDVTGNGFDATRFSGTPVRVAHGDGYAMELDGNASVTIPADPIAGTGSFTISIWFYAENPTSNYKLLSDAWWRGGCNASGWNIGTHYPQGWSGGGDPCEPWDRDTSLYQSNPACVTCWAEDWNASSWNHAVITLDDNTMRMYVNGQIWEEMESRGIGVGAGNGEIVVGQWMGSFGLRGMIDELRIYDVALSEAQVSHLHDAVNPGR